MAKFTSKNIEFLDGQKAIFGSEDNSAIYWDTTVDQLVISTVVSGVDPTMDGHLITKRYFENILFGDPTTSGTEPIGNILYGSEFYYVISEGSSSTNSTTYQNKITLSVDIPDGDYRLGWHLEWRISKSNSEINYRVREDDTTNLVERTISPFVDVSVWNPATNFYYLPAVSSGTHTFTMDYRSSSTGTTAYIRAARLEFWRVS